MMYLYESPELQLKLHAVWRLPELLPHFGHSQFPTGSGWDPEAFFRSAVIPGLTRNLHSPRA